MFCDEAKIYCVGGKGGNGMVSMRREKYVPKGGPDGGDGGRGGNIIFKADHNQNTLSKYKATYKFTAEDGEKGGDKNKHGKNGEDRILYVPIGTMIKIDDRVIDLDTNDQEAIIIKGGRGGYGNSHFKSSLNKAPKFAEKGEPGAESEIFLELKLVADVGIIGFPSVGKSTLISVISNSKPKIAEYHFTTLVPNLGVAKIDDDELVIADIPGLIEGASEGKGLGNQFLKHIERCRVVIHLLDINSNSITEDYLKIRNELKKYSPILAKKKEIIAFSKIDTVPDDIVNLLIEEFKKNTPKMKKSTIFCISSIAKKGLDELLRYVNQMVKEQKVDEKVNVVGKDKLEYKTYRPHLELRDDSWDTELIGNKYYIYGKKIEQVAKMTDWRNESAIIHLKNILLKKKIINSLDQKGFEYGKPLFIGDIDITWMYENQDY